MGRKNRRNKAEYDGRLGFNPNKYINHDNARGERYERSNQSPHRGEVWFAELGYHGDTSVQNGCRLVIIVSNDECERY